MSKLKCGLIGCWLLLSFSLMAQEQTEEDSSFLSQSKRVEYEVNNFDVSMEIVKADEEGLMLVKETSVRTDGGFVWELSYLDTALVEQWHVNITVKYGMTFMGHDFNGESFFLLFSKGEYKLDELYVIKVEKENGHATDFHVNTVLPLTLTHFEVIDQALIFGGDSNNRPVVLFYELESNKPTVLPGIYNNKTEIVDILINDDAGIFTVVVNEKSQGRDVTISLKLFSKQGKSLHTSTLKTVYEKSLIDGVPTDFDYGIQYVAGTYSARNSEISKGIYIAKLVYGEQEFIKFHSYGELDNFFGYLNDKQEQRMKSKIEKRKGSGKDMNLNYRLMVHDIVQREDEFILIGEAYIPKYSSTTSVQGSMINPYVQNGQQPSYAQPKLLGYNYTHAIVVGFSAEGDVIWDNSFEINDVQVFPLIENVQVKVDPNKIVLMYSSDNSLKTKIIQGDSVLEGKSMNDIKLKYESDEVKESISGMEGIKWWYGKCFYAYGMQKIKNPSDDGVKLNRKVFYINKVGY
ncbi:hypothetical protein BFP72_09870 [Reichenbachiella sp. 5M10]|uniref:hypothetical protein n=1 Tax=Reichenbachiella sp. 5M10 TaxID=1889772 RepID=UPI000C148E22|nr:hypothetical protein [Reichenbachiella sp. 5M10]PIB35677.1 hypothetical protein BFP72_09870 [Reichenbachiella sp. 5M10]